MGGDAHTCALICSAVGGLILSHYRESAAGAMAPARAAARMSVLPLDQAGGVFHQGLLPSCATTRKKKKHQENKTAVVGTCEMRWPFSLGSQRNKKEAILFTISTFPPPTPLPSTSSSSSSSFMDEKMAGFG